MSSIEFVRTGSKGAIGPLARLAPALVVMVDDEEVAVIGKHGESAIVELEPGHHTALVGWKDGVVARLSPGAPVSDPYAFELARDERLTLSCGIRKNRFGRAAARQALVLEIWT